MIPADELRWGEQLAALLPPFLERLILRRWHTLHVRALLLGETPGDRKRKANTWLREVCTEADVLRRHGVAINAPDSEVRERAESLACECQRLFSRVRDEERLWRAVAALALRAAVVLPDDLTRVQLMRRLSDASWWRRRLRAGLNQAAEQFARNLGTVHERAHAYVSEDGLSRWRSMRARNAKMLAEHAAYSADGLVLPLEECMHGGVANPAIRRAELMTRIAGTEAIAFDLGHAALFLTLTSPSAYHATLSAGQPNPKYQGASVRETQAYLNGVWQRTRAQWAKQGIQPYGVRTVEPHHDGTPHWHVLLFVPAAQAETMVAVFRAQALKVDGNESGAAEHRFTVVDIDRSRGSAAAYIAKYISKNIDGEGVERDRDTTLSGTDRAERALAWAHVWGIRQFQTIGQAPVSVWRELRRLSGVHADATIEAARRAADEGRWADFLRVMGGPGCARVQQPLALFRVWSDKRNKYGEAVGEQVKGVYRRVADALAKTAKAITRATEWTLAPLAVAKAEALRILQTRAGLRAPWTGENNCNSGVEPDRNGSHPNPRVGLRRRLKALVEQWQGVWLKGCGSVEGLAALREAVGLCEALGRRVPPGWVPAVG